MGREIEFRAWDKNLCAMVRIISLNFRHECGYILANHPDSAKLGRDDTYMLDKADCEIMQYTGLLDKNGVKIFEGDIVKLLTIEHEKGGWRSNEKAQGVIEFNDVWGVRFMCKDFTQRTASAQFKMKSLTSREVINIKILGNIHQNPELLEKRQC